MTPRLRLAAGIALAAALIHAAAAFSTPPPLLRPGPARAVRRDSTASLGAHLRLAGGIPAPVARWRAPLAPSP
jgi:hypothetical protein